jgi:hypothetical protein
MACSCSGRRAENPQCVEIAFWRVATDQLEGVVDMRRS